MARTLYDKIWDEHVVHTEEDGTAILYIDRHLVHEVTSPQAFEGLREAGRKVDALEAAVYLTIAVDENAATAEKRIDDFLQAYYGRRPDILKKHQACFAGSASAAADWLNSYVEQGARYLVLRFAGEHERQLEVFAKIRETIRA